MARRKREPPPGPTRPEFWRSPLRGPGFTALLGTLLFPGLILVAATGFVSHIAYQPDLGANAIVDPGRDLLWLFGSSWPTRPSWLYAATQGTHVVLGIVLLPLLLTKLWSVIPKLFAWPPVSNPAQAIERISLLGLVGGALFQFATGIVNVQLYYPFHFNFVVAHYYGAIIFTAALAIHVVVKLPSVRSAYRTRQSLEPLMQSLADTKPEPYVAGGLAPPSPAAPTITRRGVLGLSGAAAGALFLTTAGQSIGGPLRRLSALAPRGGEFGPGPNDFPVNKTAATARVTPAMTGPDWSLELVGAERRFFTRDELLEMPQATESLPIACVEGWSALRSWTGVPLAALADLVDAAEADSVHVESLQPRGVLRQATLAGNQIHDRRSLLALKVQGADLSLDHGYPARIIVPALPGVHNTKWVARMTFGTT